MSSLWHKIFQGFFRFGEIGMNIREVSPSESVNYLSASLDTLGEENTANGAPKHI